MTIASELTTLNNTKQAIKAAIEAKGQDLEGVPFAGYPSKIEAISGVASAWTRDPLWLALPTLATKGMVGLKAINDTTNEVLALKGIGGAYTVDWGDGVVENFAAGATAYHVYTFSSISAGTTLTNGSRQAIVKVYPQSGQSFTSIDLGIKHTRHSSAVYESGWLDINLSTNTSGIKPSLAVYLADADEDLYENNVYMDQLERFVWASDGFTGTELSGMFYTLSSLGSVSLPPLGAVTDMRFMFSDCYSLQTISLPTSNAVKDMSHMFMGCYSLQTIPLLNTAAVVYMSGMFSGCYSLQTIPLLNTAAVTSMSWMFQSCYSLQTIPLLNTAAVKYMDGMFHGCRSLQTIPLLNTAAVMSMSFMFSGCRSLQTIPLLNTAAVTSMSNMFSGCSSLSRIRASGFRLSFSVANCLLSAEALNEIYTNLPTITGRTITVTGNFGTASDNPSIATAKGWTVTG